MSNRTRSTPLLVGLFSLGLAVASAAHAAQTPLRPAARDYRVSERGADFKVMQSIRATTNTAGQAVSVTNRYTALGNGMNKLDANSNWVECVPVVQSFPSGIVCTGANYRVILKPNLNRQGSVDFEMNDGQRIKSHPLAIAYFDPESGRREWLSAISDCQAEVISNKVIYANAFTNGGIEAAVVYSYGVGRFHQDIVFTRNPAVTPADLGMGSRTRLEIVTEIMEAPEPVKRTRIMKTEKNPAVRGRMVEPDLTDETLVFNERMRIALGWAFQTEASVTNKLHRVPVAKQLRTMAGNRKVLVETVEWNRVSAELGKLPPRFAGVAPARTKWIAQSMPPRPLAERDLESFTARLASVTKSPPLELAAMSGPPQGFAVDYDFLYGGGRLYVTTGTYVIDQELDFYGFSGSGGNPVIKFYDGGGLIVHDYGEFNHGVLVMTSADDDSVGEIVDGSSGQPTQWGQYRAFQMDTEGNSTTWDDLDLRFMSVAIQMTCYGEHPSMGNIILRHCLVGLDLSPSSESTLGSGEYLSYCDVGTLQDLGDSENDNHINFYETADAECDDLDGDGLPDWWEHQNFGTLNYTGASDPDGDGFSNYEEYMAGTDPNDTAFTPVDKDGDGLLDAWEMANFGNLAQTGSGDYDGDGVSNLDEQTAGSDPNSIVFGVTFANLFVNSLTVTGTCNVSGGVPAFWAVLVNDTNLATATWQPYLGSNFSFTLPDADGIYAVQVVLRGLTTNFPPEVDYTTITLDRVAPVLTFTNPILSGGAATVKKPYLQLQGFSTEPLAALSYDLTNAVEWLTNQPAYVVNQFFDTNAFDLTTNYFQAYDVELTNGLNKITMTVKDRAGNETVTNLNITLDYSGSTPPALDVVWPPAGMQVSGDSFYVRGRIDDETAVLFAQVVGACATNTVEGIVERNGVFWAENLPLSAGTNTVTLLATNAAGAVTTTNFSVVKSTMVLAITYTPDGESLYDPSGSVQGTVGDIDATVTVNGAAATVETDGSWTADNVPTVGQGTATYTVVATPSSGPAATTSVAKEMPSIVRVTEHVMKQVETDPYYTTTFTKNYEASYEPDGNGNWNPKYTEHVTDTYSSSGSTTTINYDWSDTNPGTYENEDGTFPIIDIGEDNWWIQPVPHSDLDHEESNYPYRPYRFLVTHYHARLVTHHFHQSGSEQTVVLNSHTETTLYTGGKSGVNRKNLFCVTCGALEYCRTGQPGVFPWGNTPSSEVLPGSIQVLGHQLGVDGRLWLALPDNASLPMGVTVSGAKHYNATPNATKHKLDIIADGYGYTGSLETAVPKYCVGDRIIFSQQFVPPLPENPQKNPITWSLDGTFVNSSYQSNANSSVDYTQDANKLKVDTITNWWVSGGLPAATYNVQLGEGLQFTNGQYAVATTKGKIQMVRPLPQFTAAIDGSTAADMNYTLPGLWLHFGGTLSTSGIEFIYTNAPIWVAPDLTYGTYFLVQTLNASYKRNVRDSFGCHGGFNSRVGLDTSYPYGWLEFDPKNRWGYSSDSPGEEFAGGISFWDSSFSAVMYLMFDPQSGGSIAVPMYSAAWSWQARTTTTGNAPGTATLLYAPTPPTPVVQETLSFPKWPDVNTNQTGYTSHACYDEN